MTKDQFPVIGGRDKSSGRKRTLLVFISVVALIVIADQATKALVAASVPLDRGVELVPGILDIVHARNPGAAFGMFSQSVSPWRRLFFIGISIVALAVILWLVLESPRIEGFLLGGYSLFFGGTLGNLVDRVRFGEVIDFINVHWGKFYWPAFNVADSALCIGTALFLLHFLRQKGAERDTNPRSDGNREVR